MAYDIGINVVEVDGSASPSITGAATSVAGFNVLTARGIPNQPTSVTSFPQFVSKFGSYFSGGVGAYLVRGFFDNGGQLAYVNRVVGSSAATASHKLADGQSNDVLKVEAAYRGQKDPGTWGNSVFVAIDQTSSATSPLSETAAAKVPAGTALADHTDVSTVPDLSVTIDGASAATIISVKNGTFADRANATPAEIVAAINAANHQLVASLDDSKHLVLTSTGELAAITHTPTSLHVAANGPLGFAAAADPTLGTVAAFNDNGSRLAIPGKFNVGDELVISDGTHTQRTVLASINAKDGTVTWSPKLTNAADFADTHKVKVSNAEFTLTIASGAGDTDHVVETFTSLSMQAGLPNYAPRVVNNLLTGSRFVTLTDQLSADADRPAATDPRWAALTGGVDGTPTATDFNGDPAAHTGFYAFDPYSIQLLCCERTDLDVARTALSYCENRQDAMFIGAVPEGYVGAKQAIGYGKTLQTAKAYGALYGPWIIVPDPIGLGDGPRITIPPTGHVAGVYARIETTRGIWKAPAGDEANLRGVLDVETALSDGDHTQLVTDGSVNGIRAVPRAGVVIDASRTLSTDPRWRYVNVRLLFNYVKSSLRDGLRWARQEPNSDSLWRSIRTTTVAPFLLGLWRQGAFGSGTVDQTFTVIVDATNNPPAQVEQGLLKVEVYFYPSRPAETIVILVGQQASGATVSES
jgi:phage tail sheath protein FI